MLQVPSQQGTERTRIVHPTQLTNGKNHLDLDLDKQYNYQSLPQRRDDFSLKVQAEIPAAPTLQFISTQTTQVIALQQEYIS